jgi:hypothetical protein
MKLKERNTGKPGEKEGLTTGKSRASILLL